MHTNQHHLISTIRATSRRAAGALVILAAVAGLSGVVAKPASALTSSQWGSGWLTRSAAGGVTSWVSTGAKAKLLDVGGGTWKVTFTGITGGFGVPAVTPGNDDPGGSCTVDSWTALGGDATVQFHCVKQDGTPAKTGFSASYTTNVGAREGWAYAQLPNAEVYTPTLFYNAAGGTATVYQTVTGNYGVQFDGLNILPSDGSYTVNAVGWTDAHCSVDGTTREGTATSVDVRCADPFGNPTNVPFVVHIVGNRAPLATATPKAGWALDRSPGVYGTTTISSSDSFTTNAKPVTVAHVKAGQYTFKFPGLAATGSRMAQAFAQPMLDDPRCTAGSTTLNGAAIVTVKCRDETGQPADVQVDVEYEGV
jgi:hypothetical protein